MHNQPYEPQPDDIRRECETLQRQWDPTTRDSRAGARSEPITVPVIIMAELDAAIGEMIEGTD
jgi:hypothetical protein